MKKKLERKLLAAGIEIEVSRATGKDVRFIKFGNICLILDQSPSPTFKECKEFLQFEGKDWDGLKKRLEESEDWIRAPYGIYSNKFECGLFDDRAALFNNRFGCWDEAKNEYKFKYNNCWKLLDKIDAAKAKGGKQLVKFKGNKYEFDFPPIAVLQKGGEKVIDKDGVKKPEVTEPSFGKATATPSTIEGKRKRRLAIEKTLRAMTKEEKASEKGKALINERKLLVKAYNKQCEEIRKEEANEPAWESVTGWDSIKDGEYWDCIIPSLPIATKKQAQQILAFSQLTQIHKAMMEVERMEVIKTSIGLCGEIYSIGFDGTAEYDLIDNDSVHESFIAQCTPFIIDFYTKEQRDHFIEHNEDLIKQYLGI